MERFFEVFEDAVGAISNVVRSVPAPVEDERGDFDSSFDKRTDRNMLSAIAIGVGGSSGIIDDITDDYAEFYNFVSPAVNFVGFTVLSCVSTASKFYSYHTNGVEEILGSK